VLTRLYYINRFLLPTITNFPSPRLASMQFPGVASIPLEQLSPSPILSLACFLSFRHCTEAATILTTTSLSYQKSCWKVRRSTRRQCSIVQHCSVLRLCSIFSTARLASFARSNVLDFATLFSDTNHDSIERP
jgi:hypothetical protein